MDLSRGRPSPRGVPSAAGAVTRFVSAAAAAGGAVSTPRAVASRHVV